MSVVEKAVQFGQPVLLQNISEEIDPSINPILAKAVVRQGGQNMIKVLSSLFFTFFLILLFQLA